MGDAVTRMQLLGWISFAFANPLLQKASDALGLFCNCVTALLFAVSFLTLAILVCGRFPKGLSFVFGPQGMPFGVRVRALFVCGRSRVAQRTFFDFALLESGGRSLTAVEWRGLVRSFAAFWETTDHAAPVMRVGNCLRLADGDFSSGVERYFSYMSQPGIRKAYELPAAGTPFATRIEIEEAYVTPTCLLTGILHRYEHNWEVMVNRYVTAVAGHGGGCRPIPLELYNTFDWLLWGPSKELPWDGGWDGLCQVSYGDESESFPAFISRRGDAIRRMQDELSRHAESSTYGALVRATATIHPKRKYVEDYKKSSHPENAYFVNRIEDDRNVSFAVEIEDFTPYPDSRSRMYYCTAYLWILFERIGRPDDGSFHPENAVAFFEHSNLADARTLDFLSERLVDKTIVYFRDALGDTAACGRYRFVCGFNREIERRLERRYNQLVSVGDDFSRLLTERVDVCALRSPTEAFASFDEFFDVGGIGSSVVEIDRSDRRGMADLAAFYAGIYTDSFPDEDERESFENIINYMRESQAAKDWVFHALLVKDRDGGVVAGAFVDYFAKTNAGVIEFIAVDPKARYSGVGSSFFKQIVKTLDADAARLCGALTVRCVFCEVDMPNCRVGSGIGHLRFWEKNWFRKLDFRYEQPALSAAQQPVGHLWLAACPRRNASGASLPAKYVCDVIRDYVRYSMGIPDPEGNAQFSRMKQRLDSSESVALVPFFGSDSAIP